jgi:predicted permease
MMRLRGLVRRLVSMLRLRRLDRELDDEIQTHLDFAQGRYVAQGLTPHDARLAALRDFGGVGQTKERYREERGIAFLDALLHDVRYAVRALRKSPGFTVVAVFTLALGIGATTLIFSAVDGILLEPFPYKAADRLAAIYIHDLARPTLNGRELMRMPEFMAYREHNHVFDDVMGSGFLDVLYTDGAETQLFSGAVVTPNMMDFFGVGPLLGRWMTANDNTPAAAPVFVMSYRAWTEHFNSDPTIIGKSFTLNTVPRTLIAIMPPRYLPSNADIWIPIPFTHSSVEVDGFSVFLMARGRLKRGVSLAAAAADLLPIAKQLATTYPRDYPRAFTVLTKPYVDSAIGPFKGMLYALSAAVGLLLLIACSNVTNLLLARATVRERESAIRLCLGAGRGRLIGQLLVESMLLTLLACGLGCVFVAIGLKGVVALIPPHTISPSSIIEFNSRVLAFALAISAATATLCAMVPALQVLRRIPNAGLAAGRSGGSGTRQNRIRAGLVVGEVALSIVLLVGAGLMMRTLFALRHVALGFDPKNILVVRLPLPKGRYETAEQKRLLFTQAIDRIVALPGVVAATTTSNLPPYGGIGGPVTVPGSVGERWDALVQLVSEGYGPTLGLRLTRGRQLSRADIDSGRRVAVVNERLAHAFLGDENPIGRTLKFDAFDRLPGAPHNAYFEIVGVQADARNQDLQEPPVPEAFVPFNVTGMFNRGLLIRTSTDPASIESSLRKEMFALDSGIALTNVGALEDFLRQRSYSGPEFALATLGAFAGIGLLLVVGGVFSVMAYVVSLKTHDIGVRMALGAEPRDVMRMVLKNGISLVALGSTVGVAASAAFGRLLSNQIWGVSSIDPATLVSVVGMMLVVGGAACVLPASAATRIEAAVALRSE